MLGPQPLFFSLCSDCEHFPPLTQLIKLYTDHSKTYLSHQPISSAWWSLCRHATVTLNRWFSHLHFWTLSAASSITIMTILLIFQDHGLYFFPCSFFSLPSSVIQNIFLVPIILFPYTFQQALPFSNSSLLLIVSYPWAIFSPVLSVSVTIFVQ